MYIIINILLLLDTLLLITDIHARLDCLSSLLQRSQQQPAGVVAGTGICQPVPAEHAVGIL